MVTVARSDYGIYLPILRLIEKDPNLRLSLIVSGMHLSPEFGLTIQEIEDDGFEVSDRVEILLSSDSPEGVAKSMGLGVIGFAQVYARKPFDILILLGDRFEMHSAATAAMPFTIPVAHIHGGESTEGLIDEAIRHSITKMSHLHFTATRQYAERIVQLGEEPWRVVVSGAPSLDNINSVQLMDRRELEQTFQIDLSQPPLLITYHPVTLQYEQTKTFMQELFFALTQFDHPCVFTYPNADTGGRQIKEMILEFNQSRSNSQLVTNMGTRGYFSLMNHSLAMVGNSSSGIIEAASFKLPVVNTGIRQQGRVRNRNVIDVGWTSQEILCGLEKAASQEFRSSLYNLTNKYGDGHAANRIVEVLKNVGIDENLLIKRFHKVTK